MKFYKPEKESISEKFEYFAVVQQGNTKIKLLKEFVKPRARFEIESQHYYFMMPLQQNVLVGLYYLLQDYIDDVFDGEVPDLPNLLEES